MREPFYFYCTTVVYGNTEYSIILVNVYCATYKYS